MQEQQRLLVSLKYKQESRTAGSYLQEAILW